MPKYEVDQRGVLQNKKICEQKISTIFFDIDKTLTDEISWLKLTDGLGASVQKHTEIFDKFKANKLSYSIAKQKLIKLWQKTGKANKSYIEKMFRSWKLKSDAREIIDYLKKSYQLCIISGSVDLYVQTVAEKLGISDWYANAELVWDKKGNLIDFNYSRDQARKKLEHLNEYIARYDLNKNECAVVGDGENDVELFKKLPFGIAVNKNSEHELKNIATKNISELKQLKEIF